MTPKFYQTKNILIKSRQSKLNIILLGFKDRIYFIIEVLRLHFFTSKKNKKTDSISEGSNLFTATFNSVTTKSNAGTASGLLDAVNKFEVKPKFA